MRGIEYQCWAPLASPLSVEFPAELLLELGWSDMCGVMYGSRRGSEVRVTALALNRDTSGEGLEKVGVFVSRIRGEVFLTEDDLAFLEEQGSDLALVVVEKRAGFFVREANGSIQTVRSHEEFSAGETSLAIRAPENAVQPRAAHKRPRRGVPAGAIAMGLFPVVALAAVAVFPPHVVAPRSIEVSQIEVDQIGRQVRIFWAPPQDAILTIEDAGSRVSIPVYADQTSLTYAPKGEEIDLGLAGVDGLSRFRRVSRHYSLKPERPLKPEP
jgi:hypothetical protein